MEITYTTKRWGGEIASMGGVGGYVSVDPVIRVRWNDARETSLVVTDNGRAIVARAYHGGIAYGLKPVSGDIETVAAHWIAAITRRLQEKRLQDRVRGGVARHEIPERLQAWNVDISAKRTA